VTLAPGHPGVSTAIEAVSKPDDEIKKWMRDESRIHYPPPNQISVSAFPAANGNVVLDESYMLHPANSGDCAEADVIVPNKASPRVNPRICLFMIFTGYCFGRKTAKFMPPVGLVWTI
jgi:hypothetical protein